MTTFTTYDVVIRARLQNVAQTAPLAAVRVATTAAGTLASSFANGQVVDGVTLATSDRILIKNQAAPAENGVYVVGAGAPTRATDANSWVLLTGANVPVTSGTVNAGKSFVFNVAAGGTLNTTALNVSLFDVQSATCGQFPLDTGITAGAATVTDVKLMVNGREVATAAGDPGMTAAELTTLAAAIKQAIVDNID
jgi:hypothetical protein